MVWDSTRQRVVLFGGITNLAGTNFAPAETWTFDGANWQRVATIGPSPRRNHCMAFDSARGKVVLFGGSSPSQLLRDTWEWDGTSWQLLNTGGPAARWGRCDVLRPHSQCLRVDLWRWVSGVQAPARFTMTRGNGTGQPGPSESRPVRPRESIQLPPSMLAGREEFLLKVCGAKLRDASIGYVGVWRSAMVRCKPSRIHIHASARLR
jgi:hypothetical protein